MDEPKGARSWRGYIGLSLVWLFILGAVLLVTRRPAARPIEILPPSTMPPTATPAASPTPGPLRIDVAGAVRAPGVYSLPAGSIVADAIAAAGGPAEGADLDRINKAIALQDGMQVYVPHTAQPDPPPLLNPAPQATTRAAASDGSRKLVNINTATVEELDTLPGVGPTMAQRIIDGRPYGAIEELMRVKGIGQATFEKLKDLITVR
jgi:competence protein ComEA